MGDFQDITYDYDRVGNITRIVDESETEAKKTTLFTYDDLHRLKSASTTATTTTPYSRTYSYNALGNITNKSDQGNYTYSESGYTNPHAVTSIGGTSYVYDNNGNMTSGGDWNYQWDYRNRLTQAHTGSATTTYTYDHNNLRTQKTVDGEATIHPNAYYNIQGATTTKHILGPNGELIATIEGNGVSTSTNYIHLDHLGGTNVVSNEEGERVQLVDYYPFGEERIDVKETTFDEQRKFTGHEYDEDENLTYAKQRYYGQDYGRFLSVDPVVRDLVVDERTPLVLQDPQLANAYSYARNNPLILVDPDGELAELVTRAVNIKFLGLTLTIGAHSFVKITNDETGVVTTLGGYNRNDVLTKGRNDESDAGLSEGQYLSSNVIIPPSSYEGDNETFEQSLNDVYNSLPNEIGEYSVFGRPGLLGAGNSNNVASEIFIGAGVDPSVVGGYGAPGKATPGLGQRLKQGEED